MLTYRVDDMTCGHCARSITKAVRAVDAGAKVEVDISQHLVRVQPTETTPAEISQAIADAGYTPAQVEQQTTGNRAAKAGGCCGCCK